jgi:hypothetical protein
MAKFEVQSGEQVMERVRIGILTRKGGARQLIVTDRRLVIVDSMSLLSVVLFGWLTALFAAARRNKRIHYEVARGSLEQVELVGKRRLVMHTQGEGYAAQHIQIDNIADAERWKDRLTVWNASTAGAELLPTARVIEH